MIPLLATTYVGIQGLALTGVHQDVAGTQRGAGAGGFIEIQAGGRRVRIHLEGIPTVSVPQRSSVVYGQATPAIGIVDGAVRVGLDSEGNLFAGIGADVINQHTPLPAQDSIVASRLAGIRYELGYHLPLGSVHFAEALVGVAPSLWGQDIYTYSVPVLAYDRQERASAVDYSLAYGWQSAHSEWLVGLRTINFAARFTATGAAADRNAALGVLGEWRALLSH